MGGVSYSIFPPMSEDSVTVSFILLPYEIYPLIFKELGLKDLGRLYLLSNAFNKRLENLRPERNEHPWNLTINPFQVEYPDSKFTFKLVSRPKNHYLLFRNTQHKKSSTYLVPVNISDPTDNLITKTIIFGNSNNLKIFCGVEANIYMVAQNEYGVVSSPSMIKLPIPRVIPRYYYCFNGEAKIHLYNGTMKDCQDVEVGDILLSANGIPTEVKRIKRTEINSMYNMVQLGDFWITRGHPIFVNGDWYRPDELYPVKPTYIDTLYNFYAEPDHFLLVGENNPVTCSSLGGYCPRLAEIDPFTDIIYGRGYGSRQAEQYSWLLSLKERIPDDQVVPKEPKFYETLIPGREDLQIEIKLPKK
jgi:hypothetical protein